MQGVSGLLQAGPVVVHSTSGRGHSPEELADMCLGKLIAISDTAPPVIRDQAMALRERFRSILLHYMKQAARSDRTTLYNQLREAGQLEAAELMLKL